jgi:hypothetical protein
LIDINRIFNESIPIFKNIVFINKIDKAGKRLFDDIRVTIDELTPE